MCVNNHKMNLSQTLMLVYYTNIGINSIKKFGFIHCSALDTYYLVVPNFKDDYEELKIYAYNGFNGKI